MVHEYPTDDEPPELLVRYEVIARRASDFALCEETHQTEAEAHRAAKSYFARGFGVTVRRVVKDTIAEWDYPRRRPMAAYEYEMNDPEPWQRSHHEAQKEIARLQAERDDLADIKGQRDELAQRCDEIIAERDELAREVERLRDLFVCHISRLSSAGDAIVGWVADEAPYDLLKSRWDTARSDAFAALEGDDA